MVQRARFGFRPSDGKPQFRIVLPGVDIDAATWAQIVFDADYAVTRLAYSGSVAYSGAQGRNFQTLLTWPDMGYIPFTLIAAYSANGYRYYQSDPPIGPYGPSWEGEAIMACTYMATYNDINSVDATVTRTSLQARSCFSFSGQLTYAVFGIPAG
ncbi:hypothetical protein ACETRX_02885 [Labrys portucalensis]|uniref:Uncharacterized protein n=1 Tax=Labrys neptuniae TaxID=376174 RepID=A0ABV6Z8N0_9HYPH